MEERIEYPETPKVPVTETIHGVDVVDDYRWLEDGDDPEVLEWEKAQAEIARSLIDALPQRRFMIKRLSELWRYDDERIPRAVVDGDRVFFYARKADDEKWSYATRKNLEAPAEVLINPNEWDETEGLNGAYPSRDGRYVAFGKDVGGDENPVIRILDVETGKLLPDTLKGWRQRLVSWLPGNSGFYYIANPLAGEVPEGEEYYWFAVYFHRLGTPAEKDVEIFGHDSIKEYIHLAEVTEDGLHVLFFRRLFDSNEVYYKEINDNGPIRPLVTGFDAKYRVGTVDGKFLILTDLNAPMYRVLVTDVDKPERENWRELIPEDPDNKLTDIIPACGRIYAVYDHKAHALVKIFDLNGGFVRDLKLPTLGSVSVIGLWSKPDVWVSFSSFAYPTTRFKYDFENDRLDVYWKYPVKIEAGDFATEQVWYESKDGTPVSMFIVHRKGLTRDGNNAALLTGYGGFNVSRKPLFTPAIAAWLEAGGIFALPNLRGGGEYGRRWHEAGMLEKKQNVFDDFIAAAEWLIDNRYSKHDKLAIMGGSNGGLLVGAATVQRPDLFRAVCCNMPLLDMVRYHRFGFANIWAEEYGSSEDPAQFEYLFEYSPYHNVVDGTDYPAVLVTGSDKDARTDPLHARKMAARLQEANPSGDEPILLLIRRASGHHGGTTLSTLIEQVADEWSFLMYYLDMEVPEI